MLDAIFKFHNASESGSGTINEPFTFPNSKLDQTTVSILLTSTTTLFRSKNKSSLMELNATAGVFMVLMIVIAIAILLCCCKTYILCKRKRRRRRQLENDVNELQRGGLHQHLPISNRYSDNPPSYSDILSGKISTIVTTHHKDSDETSSHTISNPKTSEDSIEVHWSSEEEPDVTPPPLYSCIVLENRFISQGHDDEPPSYENSVTAPCSGRQTVFRSQVYHMPRSTNPINSVSHTVFRAFHTMFAFLHKKTDNYSSRSSDPTLNISCDGNVTRSNASCSSTCVSIGT